MLKDMTGSSEKRGVVDSNAEAHEVLNLKRQTNDNNMFYLNTVNIKA